MKPTGKLLLRVVMLIVVVLVGALGWLIWQGNRSAPTPPSTVDFNDSSLIQRGAYLARIGNCASCHSTTGGSPYAGGRAIPTRFGIFYGSNLTPDPEHGIGNWSADDFWQAMHNGKRPDGTLLYPAFPYTSYTRLSRDDVDALYAYLRSQAAVAQVNQAHQLRFPYSQRPLLAIWRAWHFKPASFTPDADQTPLWNRGAYLSTGLGHCAECHTPRTRFGGLDRARPLAGSLMPDEDWFAPALTPSAPNGLSDWSEQDIVELLRVGYNRHGVATGPMAEVVFQSTQFLHEDDALALAHYLSELPGTGQAERAAVADRLHTMGSRIYEQQCSTCHGEQGEGQAPGWPALAGNLTLTLDSPLNAIRKVLDGGFAPGTVLNPQPYGMPPYRHRLSDTDIAAVLSYARNQWGNAARPVMPNEVRRARTLGQH